MTNVIMAIVWALFAAVAYETGADGKMFFFGFMAVMNLLFGLSNLRN